MKKFVFPLSALLLTLIFLYWSPISHDDKASTGSEGRLIAADHNVVIVTVELQDAGITFSRAQELMRLRPLEQDFIHIAGVSKVESLLSTSRVISQAEDIIVEKAIPAQKERVSDAYLESLAAEIDQYPELSPYVDESLDTLLFYIYFTRSAAPVEIHNALQSLQQQWEASIPFEYTGRSPVIAETESLLTRDIFMLFPLLILMLVLVFSVFRSIMVLLVSLFLIFLSIVFGYGFARFSALENSPLILLIPIFSLGLLSDYLIHYFYHSIYQSENSDRSVRKDLLFPLSLTALSTVIGFLSLSVINGSGHLQLGIIIAVAVMATWIGVFFWLDYLEFKSSSRQLMANFQIWQGRIFAQIVRFRYVCFGLIFIAFSWGLFQLNNLSIEPYPIEQLPGNTTIANADRVINSDFYGTVPFFIEVDTGEKNGILTKQSMLELENIHRLMDESGIGFSYSLLTVLKRMNYYFQGDEESLLTSSEFDDFYGSLIEQYLLYFSSIVDPQEYGSLLDNAYRVFSVRGLIYYRNYEDLAGFLDVLDVLRENFPPNWTLSLHGMARELQREHSNLLNNWLISFLGGSLLIFVTVWIFYKKFTLALLSLIPGVISMVISFGFITLAGISIDVFSIIFVAIITGLVIDYSIHTLAAIDRMDSVPDVEQGFRAIFGYSGIPIFLSFLTSIISFSILFLSSFTGARNLAFLLLFSLVFSFFLSLYLIPLIILPIRWLKEKNNVSH